MKFRRARIVRGRLVTHDGKPAVKFRVAPLDPDGGEPEPAEVVEADSDGRFSLGGVDRGRIAIAVYCPVRPVPEDPVERMNSASWATPMNPVRLRKVGRREHDLGVIELPRLGNLVVQLSVANGSPARGGCVFWSLPGVLQALQSALVDEEGAARFEGVPQDLPLEFDVNAIDATLGELRARFSVDRVVDGTVSYRVTGAGTVVIRLESNGTPVEVPWVSLNPAVALGAGFEGRASEFRDWTAPGIYSEMRVNAPGYAPCFLRNVTVRDDGPTYLTAELERP